MVSTKIQKIDQLQI